jgi:two-component system OmpR family sensor kinase
MSLRSRITILTALLILFSTAVLGAFVYFTASSIQYQTIDNGLRSAVADARIQSLSNNPRPAPPDSASPDSYNQIAIARVNRDNTITVLRQAGYSSDPLPFPTLTAAQLAQSQQTAITVPGEVTYRVVARQPDPRRAMAVAATPLTDVESNLKQLAISIITAVALVTIIGALTSWAVVRKFFRPVDAMVDSAQAIAQGDTQRRVPTAQPGTELGELSVALNAMIGALTESITRVEASEVQLRKFVSNASHEIRTPLTVIRGYVELLQSESPDASDLQTRALTRIATESHRLEGLVTQLLVLENMDSLAKQEFAEFDLSQIVRDFFDDLTALNPGRPILLDLGSCFINGEPNAWRQLVSNLVQNISRHTPPNSAVEVHLIQHEGETILTVDDAGPGIPIGQREAVLQRFTRLDETPSTSSGGFGLGMSIIGAVIAAHGGRLELLDSPLGGLRVQLTIPAS